MSDNKRQECIHCGHTKMLSEFYKTYAKGYDGYRKNCKKCQAFKGNLINECRSYIEGIHMHLKCALANGRRDDYTVKQLETLYAKSLYWVTERPQTVVSQYYKEKNVLVPIMHLLPGFKETTKKCTKCNQVLCVGVFSKNSRYISGLHKYCKVCMMGYKKIDTGSDDAIIKDTGRGNDS